MRILSFDFGTKTGWASFDGERIESGVQEFALGRGESPGMRFLRFGVWIESMINLIKPEACAYELAHHRGGFATELLVGMVTRLQEKCAVHGVEYMPVHSATLKKFATGSGRADKVQMVKKAQEKFPGRPIADDNEADALLLLDYAINKLGGKNV
jgi:Holliday junction resolvasome RuvABC endonuclease subunit